MTFNSQSNFKPNSTPDNTTVLSKSAFVAVTRSVPFYCCLLTKVQLLRNNSDTTITGFYNVAQHSKNLTKCARLHPVLHLIYVSSYPKFHHRYRRHLKPFIWYKAPNRSIVIIGVFFMPVSHTLWDREGCCTYANEEKMVIRGHGNGHEHSVDSIRLLQRE